MKKANIEYLCVSDYGNGIYVHMITTPNYLSKQLGLHGKNILGQNLSFLSV